MKHNQEFIDYKSTLPKGRGGIAWTIESFSTAVKLLAPGFVVEDGQEWVSYMQPMWLVCPVHGRYKVTPNDFLKQCNGSGCAKCHAQKNSDSAGIVRKPRASEAEKEKHESFTLNSVTMLRLQGLLAELDQQSNVGVILSKLNGKD
ncbi:hypothetical protein SynSYN20_01744 [Synechococcus sp. SYN20]|uniref:hypothetical protein n=1 Tax=Synechococcus sp. SYN20 TaxID=1050714 RepID=UPI0016442961|nr:hypothetical protein [Synechococcus sp. SYN20]QNJ26070.1 hypothetical protein SynSYN20_01744 [Synechococcus sp. SYN20]